MTLPSSPRVFPPAAGGGSPQEARPGAGLLVSVSDLEEARAAIAAGVDLLDVKDPGRGPLGRAEAAVVENIAREATAAGIPLTAALGELRELGDAAGESLPRGVAAFKLGLSGAANGALPWEGLLERWRRRCEQAGALLIPCAYADAPAAGAPAPREVLERVLGWGPGWFLLDTWLKDGRGLLEHAPPELLRSLVDLAASAGIHVAFAGSLRSSDLEVLLPLGPAVIAVRGAVCAGGDRTARVDAGRIRQLKLELAG